MKEMLLIHNHGMRETSRYQKYLHEENSPGTILKDSEGKIQGTLIDNEIEASSAVDDATVLGRETFSVLHGDPEPVENPTCSKWLQYITGLIDSTPEFEEFRDACRGDNDFSLIGAAGLLEDINDDLSSYFNEIAPHEDQDDDGEGSENPHGFNEAKWTNEALKGKIKSSIIKHTQDIAETKAMLSALCPGSEEAPPDSDGNSANRYKLIKKLKNSKEIHKLLEKAGAIMSVYRNEVQKKAIQGSEEIVDIERGNDLSRLLPISLGMFGHPVYEKLAQRDFIERKLLQYQLVGYDQMGRGDMVLMIDESGSMSNSAFGGDSLHDWARAIAISAISIAKRENRRVTIIGFTTEPRYVAHFDRKGSATWNDEPIDPLSCIVKILEMNCSGGTKFDPVLKFGLGHIAEGRSDLIFITDGEATASQTTLDILRSKSELGVYGIQIGGSGHIKGVLKEVCTSVVNLDTNRPIAEAIGSVFS